MKSIKIKSEDVVNSMRMDGGFHLSETTLIERAIGKMGFKPLSFYADRIFTAGRKKRIYTTKNYGYPYLSNSDVITNNPFYNSKYNSKKYGYDSNAILNEGMIVTGRVGAIGQTAFITKYFENKESMGSDNIIRIQTIDPNIRGFIYAYLTSKIGNTFLWKYATGGVQSYINEDMVASIPIPNYNDLLKKEIHNLILECATLRDNANEIMDAVDRKMHLELKLEYLKPNEYNYFGPRSSQKTSHFSKNINEIDTTTINAFNYSFLIEQLIDRVGQKNQTLPLSMVLDEKQIFSTGSFPRIEVKSNKGIMLINQSDIFDTIIKGKRISKRKVKTDNLAQYGEVMIAGVGTLGENETFCRVIFANEDIQGQLVSGEFIRMKTNSEVPSGYLYAWLNTDYGFRFIRSTQSGTKLCRPIPRLLLKLPVPILDKSIMLEIHNMVTKAHTLRYEANQKELQAIQLVENEIEQWQH